MPTPRPVPGQPPRNGLTAVSCHTQNFCLAVGYRTDATGVDSATYAARWNGTAWAVISAPFGDSVPSVSDLGGVSCPARNRCQVVSTAASVASTMSANLASEFVG